MFWATRGMKKWPVPPSFKDIIMPPMENRKLPFIDAIPVLPAGLKPHKYQRRPYDSRGPELIHNQLIYNQYGIVALSGGKLTPDHINNIRNVINKHLDVKKSFAIWRIDPPWKSETRKGIGKRMGGGKPSIHHYVSPVKAGRIILEIGGQLEFEEIYYFVNSVAVRLPFHAVTISAEILKDLQEERDELKAKNVNPLNYKRIIQQNILNSKHDMSNPNDDLWFGQYI